MKLASTLKLGCFLLAGLAAGNLVADELDVRRRIVEKDALTVSNAAGNAVFFATNVTLRGGVLTPSAAVFAETDAEPSLVRAGAQAFAPQTDGYSLALTNATWSVTNGTLILDGAAAPVTVSLKNVRQRLAGAAYDGELLSATGAVTVVAENFESDFCGDPSLKGDSARTKQSICLGSDMAGKSASYTFVDSFLRWRSWNFALLALGGASLTLDNSQMDLGNWFSTTDRTFNFAVTRGAEAEITLKGAGAFLRNEYATCNYGTDDSNNDPGFCRVTVLDGAALVGRTENWLSQMNVLAVTNAFWTVPYGGMHKISRGSVFIGGESLAGAQYVYHGPRADQTDVTVDDNSFYAAFASKMPFPCAASTYKPENTISTFTLLGGVVSATRFYGNHAAYGHSYLNADGGKVEAFQTGDTAAEPFLCGVEAAKLGAKGLTVSSAGCDIHVYQDFSELANATGAGRLILEGAGAKTLGTGTATGSTGVNTESFLDVKGGKTILASGTHENAKLSVTENACFSLAGGVTAATFAGLQLGGADAAGVLEFDAGDLITIEGEAAVAKAAVRPTFDLVAGTAYDVFKAKTVADGAAAAWANAKVVAGTSPNFTYAFTTVAEGDYTVFRVTPADAGSAQAQSVAWTDDATMDRADFTLASGTKTVSGAYVSAADTNTFDIAKDAEVRFAGKAVLRKVVKKGGGRLVFDGDKARFADGLKIEGGLVSFKDFPTTAAYRGGEVIEMQTGTLAISNEVKDAFFPYVVWPKPSSANNPIIVRTDSDIRTWLPPMWYEWKTYGCFIKTGRGRMLAYPRCGSSYSLVYGLKGTIQTAPSLTEPQEFDENGAPPSFYGGLTVAEGELTIKMPGGYYTDKYSGFLVGVPRTGAVAQPGLVLDGVKIIHRSDPKFMVGWYMTELNSDSGVWSPYLVLTNGATLALVAGSDLLIGQNSTAPITPRLEVDASDIEVLGGAVNLSNAGSADALSTVVLRNKARLRSRTNASYFLRSGLDMTIDDSSYCAADGNNDYVTGGAETMIGGIYRYTTYPSATQTLKVRNGGRFAVRSFNAGNEAMQNPIVIAFDGGTWVMKMAQWPGYDDNLPTSDEFYYQGDKFGLFECRTTGKGVVFEVDMPSARLCWPVVGTGDVVKTGPGTLAFGKLKRKWGSAFYTQNTPSWQATGRLDIREGGVILDDAYGYTNAVVRAKMLEGAFLDLGGRTFGAEIFGGGALTNGVVTNAVFEIASAQTDGVAALALRADLTAENTTFKIQIDSNWKARGLVALEGGTLSGTVTLDLGRSSEDPFAGKPPVEIQIGTYAGEPPALKAWAQIGTGKSGRLGRLTAHDGKIYVDGRAAGVVMMLK